VKLRQERVFKDKVEKISKNILHSCKLYHQFKIFCRLQFLHTSLVFHYFAVIKHDKYTGPSGNACLNSNNVNFHT